MKKSKIKNQNPHLSLPGGRIFFITSLFLLMTNVVGDMAAEAYWQQSVEYTIDVRLDPEAHMLSGTETVVYHNNSPDSLRQIYFHLYPNAFRDEGTTLMRESRRYNNFNFRPWPEEKRGHIEIIDFRIDGGAVEYIESETILKAQLPRALAPGGRMIVTISFEEKVRHKSGRAGYRGAHYDFAQWYPKVVVYDEKGWHPDPFHDHGEFYGEFGTFDVSMNIPAEYVIAATGVCTSGDPGWERREVEAEADTLNGTAHKTVTFRAERVHDFAWCADPDFIVQDTTWNDIQVLSFYREWNSDWADTNLAYGLSAIQWLSKTFGQYPYPQVSIVDVPYGGGMEYPMLVMNGFLDESLVLHEVGHMYFYGILANNELDEAWLDEGFTTFQERLYMETTYGPFGRRSELNWYEKLLPKMTTRDRNLRSLLDLARDGYWEPVAIPAYEFRHSGWTMIYSKAAFFLDMLRYVVGEAAFTGIMRTYFEEWQFKHVNEERFREVCERVSGMELDWFFDQWLHTTRVCDYAIKDVERDWRWERAVKRYRTTVTTRRLGGIIMPIEIHLRLADGTEHLQRLAGREIEETVVIETDVEPEGVSINPDNEILDMNMLNNHRPWKTHLLPDLPNMSYYPQDAYLFKARPWVWYNTVDGVKAGLFIKGSYAERYSNFSLGYWYGYKSQRNDVRFAGSTPMYGLGRNTTGNILVQKMEGRVEFTTSIEKNFRGYRYYPPDIKIRLGFTHLELRHDQYVLPHEWESGRIDKAFIGLFTNPQADIFRSTLSMQAETALEPLGSDHEFTAFRCEATLKTRFSRHNFSLRAFGGFASSGTPLQEHYSIAGAGPIRRFREFFLASRGAIPDDLTYHLGGDGNLRGYLDGNTGVRKLVAFNAEYLPPYRFSYWSRYIRKYTGLSLRPVAFIDAGKVLDKDKPSTVKDGVLYDVGVGLRFKSETIFGTINLRADFPLYVNMPEINGESDELGYRWLVSLTDSF